MLGGVLGSGSSTVLCGPGGKELGFPDTAFQEKAGVKGKAAAH